MLLCSSKNIIGPKLPGFGLQVYRYISIEVAASGHKSVGGRYLSRRSTRRWYQMLIEVSTHQVNTQGPDGICTLSVAFRCEISKIIVLSFSLDSKGTSNINTNLLGIPAIQIYYVHFFHLWNMLLFCSTFIIQLL